IYDVSPLTSSGLSGAGIGVCTNPSVPCGDIAVLGQVDITNYGNDLNAFRDAAQLPRSLPGILVVPGADPGAPSNACLSNPTTTPNCTPSLADLEESMFDVEWAGAIAPSAKILYVSSTNAVVTSLIAAVAQNVAPILSLSYGACESSIPKGELLVLNAVLQQASLQGMTLIGPTGEDGATDCDTLATSANKGLAVDFPGSSPYVTSLGGTMFAADDALNASTYWKPVNGPDGGSALGYIPETVWNETPTDIGGAPPTFGAGGGGASILFVKPEWQIGLGVPQDGARDVPDISLNAASHHDGYFVCLLGSCNGAQFYDATPGPNYGNAFTFGGTSAATPPFAGIMALVEEGVGSVRLGNINPNIYAMAKGDYVNIFHDITDGNNNSPCTAKSKDCPSDGLIGFTAGIGYDLASGWGSIDATNFAREWTLFPPTAPGLPIVSRTTVTATPNSVAAGTPVSLAITVASAIPNLPYPPTGSIQIQVDGATVPTSVALSGGQVSGTLSTTGLTVGPHTVTVIYSGDSNFKSSSGQTILTIRSATGTPVASQTSVIPTPSSVTAGTAISLAITVAPSGTSANTPTGSVQILVDGATVASSVALGSGGQVTYSLNTSGLTAGSHPVTVIYSGDTNFTGSQGSTNITITGTGTVPPAGSDFTLTPSMASVSTIVGQSVPPIVFTLKPLNGFTGPVTLSTSNTSKDGLTPSFSVNPVVINSASGGSTTLTFKAFQSLASARGDANSLNHASKGSPAAKTRWYVAGSGATLACMFLLILPRRRRWGALLAVLLTIGAMGASGCGSGGTLPTNATYNITITATAAGNLSHTSAVKVTFSIR
ncbi:MAG: Ig-like domain repeat protein, partial [Edaphobacter sp.]